MYSYDNMTQEQIIQLIKCAKFADLAVSEDNKPYCIPMYYSHGFQDGKLIIYMESSDCGKKISCIKNNANVCVAIERSSERGMESAVIFGKAIILKHINECHKDEQFQCCSSIKITVTEMSGRLYKHCRL
ncbi:MAG: hypothetical protein RRY79_02530 [Clostridia bacterium]